MGGVTMALRIEYIKEPKPPKPPKPPKKKLGFTKLFLWVYGANVQIIALATLYLMNKCIELGYTGGLAALVALITFAEGSFGLVAKAVSDKSKAENTVGGIVYESAMLEHKAAATVKVDVDKLE